MNKARITEIFQSLQGEGQYTGVKQVFVRFFGCNMRCAWCDTPSCLGDAPGRFKEYDLPGLLREIDGLWQDCHSVSLTGGEPLLQKDFIKALGPRLKKKHRKVYLETNGVLPAALKEVIDNIDIVSMDFKLPSSTRCRPYWKEHEAFLKIARGREVFIKAVISSETTQEDIARSVEVAAGVDPGIPFILQPNYFERNNGAGIKCAEYRDYCARHLRDVRVLTQMHKVWQVR